MMTPYNTLFTTERGAFHQQRALSAAPPELKVTLLRHPSLDDLLPYLPETDYLISERTGVVDAQIIQAAPRLKLILRLGSLTHDIDIEAARAAGVMVSTWPDPGVIAVAEHVILQLLAVSKKLNEVQGVVRAASPDWQPSKRTDEDTFAYNWSGRTGIYNLYQGTVGILGFGEIGAEVARRLRGWGCTVLYNKRSRLPERIEQELGMAYASAEDLQAQSDYVVNMLPYFAETDLLLDAAWLSRLKPGATVVSCGSGSVIDEAALAQAVLSGHLRGAALDTFEWEPIRADNPLGVAAAGGANIVLTPHTAAGGVAASATDTSRARDYAPILHHLRGEPVPYRVV
jgi:phosphoglycerate dehydrogenase-like enzyme